MVRRLTIGGLAGLLGVAAIAAGVWTFTLPARYTAAGTVEIEAPIEVVFIAVTDGRGAGASWGGGADGLSHIPSEWTEGVQSTAVQSASVHAHQVQQVDRPAMFVTAFAESSGRSGTTTWTFEALGPSTTRVTVVQDAVVSHPLSRALLGLRRGAEADIHGQLRALESAIPGGERS
jgi:uncharacterized protein YndB with AHSA1/START domain